MKGVFTLARAKRHAEHLWWCIQLASYLTPVAPKKVTATWVSGIQRERVGSPSQPPRRYREAMVTVETHQGTITKHVCLYEDGSTVVR